MAHELEIVDGKASMVYAGATPWHGLGTKLDAYPTSREAFIAAGMDWNVGIRPIYIERPITNPAETQVYSEFIEVPSFKATVRETDGFVLGVVGDDYVPFQNWMAFEFLDSLLKDGVIKYETAGVLFNGRRVWALARLEQGMRIGNDEFTSYILAATSHDGTRAVTITPTSVRVVCNNTLTGSVGSDWSRARFSIRHSSKMGERLNEARQALQITTEATRRMKEFLERAAKVKLEAKAVQAVKDELFGLDNEEEQTAYQIRQLEKFDGIWLEESSQYGNTGYSMFNTITGFADHAMRYNGAKDNPGLSKERRMAGIIDGRSAGFKQQGIQVLQELGVK